MEIDVGALCLWLVAISIFDAGALFILTATLSLHQNRALVVTGTGLN
jgi:hypothetical protein